MELRVEPTQWGYGTWAACLIESLYARTDATIDAFISSKIMLFTSLLCSDCSESAKEKLKRRHPREYREIVDGRRERIGMFMWIVDLKNDVNEHIERETGVKKERATFEEVRDAFAAIYYKTTREIEDARRNAMDPDKIDFIPITYLLGHNTDDVNNAINPNKIAKRVVKPEEKQAPIRTTANIIKLGSAANSNAKMVKAPIILPKKVITTGLSKNTNTDTSSVETTSKTPQKCARCSAKTATV